MIKWIWNRRLPIKKSRSVQERDLLQERDLFRTEKDVFLDDLLFLFHTRSWQGATKALKEKMKEMEEKMKEASDRAEASSAKERAAREVSPLTRDEFWSNWLIAAMDLTTFWY